MSATRRYARPPAALALVMVLTLLLALSGCGVSFISNYDEQVDKTATQLHQKIELLLIDIEGHIGQPQGSYQALKPKYDEIRVEASALYVRVSSKSQNEESIKQVDLLRKNIEIMAKVHQEGFRDAGAVQVFRNQFEAAFISILRLERAKKGLSS